MKVRGVDGFWPDQDTMELAHGCYPAWATELIILRPGKNGENEILLTVYRHERKYPQFEGKWHAPGGYGRITDRYIESTCNRIATREFGESVFVLNELGKEWWEPGEHPYGRPLSILMRCELVAPIKETDERQFFPIERLPQPMIEVHERFIKKFVPLGD